MSATELETREALPVTPDGELLCPTLATSPGEQAPLHGPHTGTPHETPEEVRQLRFPRTICLPGGQSRLRRDVLLHSRLVHERTQLGQAGVRGRGSRP